MLVGPDGTDVGVGDGLRVGMLVGMLVGTDVGRSDVGAGVGLFVSPGFVGREDTGCLEGSEVGAELVGRDVGACTNTDCPTTTEADRIVRIDALASSVSRTGTPTSLAAASNSFEKEPDEMEEDTLEVIDS